jgi:hypothetical protein
MSGPGEHGQCPWPPLAIHPRVSGQSHGELHRSSPSPARPLKLSLRVLRSSKSELSSPRERRRHIDAPPLASRHRSEGDDSLATSCPGDGHRPHAGERPIAIDLELIDDPVAARLDVEELSTR